MYNKLASGIEIFNDSVSYFIYPHTLQKHNVQFFFIEKSNVNLVLPLNIFSFVKSKWQFGAWYQPNPSPSRIALIFSIFPYHCRAICWVFQLFSSVLLHLRPICSKIFKSAAPQVVSRIRKYPELQEEFWNVGQWGQCIGYNIISFVSCFFLIWSSVNA